MMILSSARKYGMSAAMALVLAFGASPARVAAAPLSLADGPVFLLTSVDPNIMFTFDDSGSMAWGYMPDAINSTPGPNARRACAANINAIYYDPNVTYVPGVDVNGNDLPDATFTGAWLNGYNPAGGTAANFATSYRVTWTTNSGTGTGGAPTSNNAYARCGFPDTSARPAFYYVYDTSLAGTGGCPST
ncbi:MAG: hypothetical protein JSW09_05715, partial [Pseudomonadota bacterium]